MSPKPLPFHLLNSLIRAPAGRFGTVAAQAVAQLARHAGAERAVVCRIGGDGPIALVHGWAAEGVTPALEADLTAAALDPWRVQLELDQPVLIARDVQDGCAVTRSVRLHALLDSPLTLVAPMLEEGSLCGFAAFGFGGLTAGPDAGMTAFLHGFAGALQGLAPRMTGEDRLLEKSAQLDAMLEALPDLLFELDAEGRFTGFAAGPAHLMFAQLGAFRGRALEEVLPEAVRPIARAAFDRVVAEGRVSGVRYRLDLPGGTRWFELSGARKPAARAGGRPGALFLVRDVTDDARLRGELSHLGKIVETMSNLVVLLDMDYTVLWVNAAFESQTGWPLAEAKGRPLIDLVGCPDGDPAVRAGLMRAIRRREPFSAEALHQDRHGTRYWVDFNMLPLSGPDGAPQGFVSVETVITRQKEQEAALALLAVSAQAARSRLENALDALPDGVIVLDAEERIVVANAAYRATIPELADVAAEGTHIAELLSAGLEAGVFVPDGAEGDPQAWVENRLAMYRQQHFTDDYRLADGRWIRRINHRTTDGGCIAIGIDVTEGRNHLAALDAANMELTRALAERDNTERRLTGIIEGADVGTWEWNIPAGTLRIGGHWAAMVGLADELGEVIALETFRDLLHPEDRGVVEEIVGAGEAAGNAIIEREFRMRHRDGHWIWIFSRGRVTTRCALGRPVISSGVNIDVSDRRRLQEEVESARSFLEQVMQTSNAATAVLDEKGALIYCNSEAERILRMARSATGPLPYEEPEWELETPDGKPLPDRNILFRRALRTSGAVRDITLAIRWPDGARRILSANAAKLEKETGGQQIVVSFSDVTDTLAATSRLEEARQRAEDASRTKSIFLANMSHEIRTPLNGVLGMTEVLDNVLTEPEHRRIAGTIRTSGENLLMILNSILDMSKIEAGKMVLETAPFVPTEIVRHSEAVFAVQAEEKGLEFEVLISAGSERPLLGDPHRIQQILNNLLHNAMKFTEAGSVHLKLTAKSGKPLVIEVTDTGIGMTETQLARVFDSFEQADGSTTRRFGGTGLGLSIVKQLVGLMGGEMEMRSEPGRGTCVRVSLPLPEPQTPPAEAARPAQKTEGLQELCLAGRRLLIADDNATNRLVLCEMLARTGAEITTVENGAEVVQAWEDLRRAGGGFDLLLLDITMPVLDGLSALIEIRKREFEADEIAVPAVAVTANAMPHQVTDYIIGGFDSHLAKPFKHRELLHVIRTLIRG